MRFRDFHINIKIRVIETFTSRLVGGMIFPFMAIYLAAHFSAKLTGMMLIFNVLIGMIAKFIGGYYADIIGRKKLMVTAEVLRLISYIMMAVANSPWFEWPLLTFFMMTVNNICWGLAGPANDAMLIDVSTPEQRKYMYSITYWANNLSIAIGGILGGLFFQSHLFELLVAIACAESITVILVVFFIQESLATAHRDGTPSVSPIGMFKVYRNVLRDRLFVLFILGNMLIFTMEDHLTNYIGIHLSDAFPTQHFWHWDIDGVNMLGFLRTENTVLVVLTSLLAVRLIAKFKDRSVLLIGSSLFVAGYTVISYTTNIWLLFLFMIVATLGEVIRVPVQQSYMALIPPDDARSSYMAVSGLDWNGAALITSLFISLSAYLSPFWMSAAIFALGFLGILFYVLALPMLEARQASQGRPTARTAP